MLPWKTQPLRMLDEEGLAGSGFSKSRVFQVLAQIGQEVKVSSPCAHP